MIHQKGQAQQTIDNILRTLSNLEIESAVAPASEPTISHAALRAKSVSKTPVAIAAVVALLAVMAFFLFKGGSPPESEKPVALAKVYKSTTDLCVVTVHGSDTEKLVSGENRELRDELNSKLSRFKDYKVILAKAVSPDATTQELLDMAKGMNAGFILHATTDSEKKRISAKVMNAADGRTFW